MVGKTGISAGKTGSWCLHLRLCAYVSVDFVFSPSLTGKPGGSFIWTNSLSLLKCLKGAITSKTFSNLRQSRWHQVRRNSTELHHAEGSTHESMPRGKSWLMATVALKFFLLSLQTSSLPRWGGLKETQTARQTPRIRVQLRMPKPFLSVAVWRAICPDAPRKPGVTTYFSLSAETYSSQEIVFGHGGVRDCLLAG